MAAGTVALIVAAGRGSRLGADLPKQYLRLGDRAILARSIQRFLELPEIDAVQVAIAEAHQTLYQTSVADIDDPRLLPPVTGGDSRSVSVRRGLEALAAHSPKRVLIHDAARPFVPRSVITNVIKALDTQAGAFAALPVVDALWSANDDTAVHPVSRDGLWRAQTPQGFVFDAILDAHQNLTADAADDVAVAREAGMTVQIVLGDEANFKITTEADLTRARDMLALLS